jgi:rhodanese-related sulfurtransferase
MAAPVRIVTARDYIRLVDGGAVPLDMRKPSEYVEGHVVGSICLPAERFLLRHDLGPVVLGRPTVIIVSGPLLLDLVLPEMEAAGTTVAGILTGTPMQWAARGLEVRGWDRVNPAQWAAMSPRPLLWDIREAHEPADPAWPEARRVPLSEWLYGEPPDFRPDIPLCLVGPVQRQILAAVALYQNGAETIWAGETVLPKIVADFGRTGTQGP